MARSTYSFLLEKDRGMLFPPGMMGTIFPSALWPTNESRGIIWKTQSGRRQDGRGGGGGSGGAGPCPTSWKVSSVMPLSSM